MEPMTRDEHVAWCKKRALEYVDMGELTNAMASMGSDLGKHPETRGHSGITMGIMLAAGGMLNTQDKMRKFIEGFN